MPEDELCERAPAGEVCERVSSAMVAREAGMDCDRVSEDELEGEVEREL